MSISEMENHLTSMKSPLDEIRKLIARVASDTKRAHNITASNVTETGNAAMEAASTPGQDCI